MEEKRAPGNAVHDPADDQNGNDDPVTGIYKTHVKYRDDQDIKTLRKPEELRENNRLAENQGKGDNKKKGKIHHGRNGWQRLVGIFIDKHFFKFIKIHAGLDNDILKQLGMDLFHIQYPAYFQPLWKNLIHP